MAVARFGPFIRDCAKWIYIHDHCKLCNGQPQTPISTHTHIREPWNTEQHGMLILLNRCLENHIHPVVGLVFGRNDIPGDPKTAISRRHFEVMDVSADSVRIKHTGGAQGQIVTAHSTDDVNTEQEITLHLGDKYFPLIAWSKFFFVLNSEAQVCDDVIEDSGVDMVKHDELVEDPKDGDNIGSMADESSLHAYREWLRWDKDENIKLGKFLVKDNTADPENSMLYKKAGSIGYLLLKRKGGLKQEAVDTKVFPCIPMLEKMIHSRVSEPLSIEHETVNNAHGFAKDSGFFSSTRINNPVIPTPPPSPTPKRTKKTQRRIVPELIL